MHINQTDDLMVADTFHTYTLLAQQLNAINLAQGIPEPIMEKEINEALLTSLNIGWQYTNSHGLESLCTALANEYDNEFTKDEVLVTSGCTESLYLGISASSKIYGNKIAFLEPFFPAYTGFAALLNLEVTYIPMLAKDNTMCPDWDSLERAIRGGTTTLLLNTPHNPSGWVMNAADAIYLRTLTDKYGLFILVDESYRYYTYDAEDANAAMRILYSNNDHILILSAASKLLSATGLRIGWMLGQKSILDTAYAIHLSTTYCHPGPLQQLVATILNNRSNNWFLEIKNHYQNKRDKLLNALNRVGFKSIVPAGGHFLLADYSNIKNDIDSNKFASYCAKEYKVMPLPTSVFYRKGTTAHQMRFSFSVTMDTIDNAISNITNSQ